MGFGIPREREESESLIKGGSRNAMVCRTHGLTKGLGLIFPRTAKNDHTIANVRLGLLTILVLTIWFNILLNSGC